MRRPNQRRERLHARQKRRWTVFVVLGCAFMGYFTYSFFFDTMGFMKYLSMKRTQAEIACGVCRHRHACLPHPSAKPRVYRAHRYRKK